MADRVIDQLAAAQPVERPEHGHLLQLPESERGAHARDLDLPAGAPPSGADAQVSYLVVRG